MSSKNAKSQLNLVYWQSNECYKIYNWFTNLNVTYNIYVRNLLVMLIYCFLTVQKTDILCL